MIAYSRRIGLGFDSANQQPADVLDHSERFYNPI